MEKFVRTAALPGVSLADILADPRTLMKDIEKIKGLQKWRPKKVTIQIYSIIPI